MIEPNYAGLSDDEASEARMADLGYLWDACNCFEHLNDWFRPVLHDRDRFQRERDWWREQVEGGA